RASSRGGGGANPSALGGLIPPKASQIQQGVPPRIGSVGASPPRQGLRWSAEALLRQVILYEKTPPANLAGGVFCFLAGGGSFHLLPTTAGGGFYPSRWSKTERRSRPTLPAAAHG